MEGHARRFEAMILRPLQVAFIFAAIPLAVRESWWWIAGGIIALLCLGSIGSALHPLQSASELAQGPLNGPAASAEARVLPPPVQAALVGGACTRVGLLLGLAVLCVLWWAFAMAWYAALVVAWITAMAVGVALKLAFGQV